MKNVTTSSLHFSFFSPCLRGFSLLSMLILGGAAMANSNCDNPINDFDGLYCLNKVYIQADVELNENYKALVTKLDANGKSQLRKTQLAWMRKRNDSCSRHDDDGFFVNLQCAAQTTIERSQFLQDRIRECVSAGCMNSRL